MAYKSAKGIDDFVARVRNASPWDLVEAEREGVNGVILKDLAERMNVPASRVFNMIGVPKATAEKKAAAGEMLKGSSGQAVIGMAKLIGIAQAILANSTAVEAKGFDVVQWLGQWLERAQPALGGRRPGDVIDTPTGLEIVSRLLRAIESGSYQ
ncbi:antitoxin Xre/MbcA/ParS toxin-binding domain-containing protein [Uliginosibacterium gangwonense]|uniref:antitoxin Xre/MbcA/ParS toxin-binding domain-containing protein n=1 Tax=Uliginosibacterium gangwonense TaxID=392736 RepID=UPI0003A758B5|nr:antitoxin Xre/MbcA/ParS toxin-binding domain-containing protein [Uliginosibacterium gangwonense]